MRKNSFVEFLYTKAAGRLILKLIQKSGVFSFAQWFLKKRASKPLIWYYIKKYNIDMSEYQGQKYNSFQKFFARKRENHDNSVTEGDFISPCDGLLSVYNIEETSVFNIKNSYYSVKELIGNEEIGTGYNGGLCLVFRLCASDYHHYCFIDDGIQGENHYIEGQLHSVQPIACESVPVYRLNRRMWTILQTVNFGDIVQVCVGALLVGGIINEKSCEMVCRGKEMGHFDLCGSTIILLIKRDTVLLNDNIRNIINSEQEVRVCMGEAIGRGTHG